MKCYRLALWMRYFALGVFCCVCAGVQGQPANIWVSGVGDDANPGQRTAPCKTFAGAISKLAAGGEIDVLDPGGFGGVTITKSVTIDGQQVMGSILVAGTPAITINVANGTVILRNLNLNCSPGGTFGVRIVSASVVKIEKCVIFGGNTNAVDFQPSGTNSFLVIKDSHIHDFSGNALFANPASGGKVVIENTTIEECGGGVSAASGSVQLGKCVIVDNKGAGLSTSGDGSIQTHLDNVVVNNNPDGNPTSAVPMR